MNANPETAMKQQPPLLQIENLTIGYRNQQGAVSQVLRGIDLTVATGETLGIVGESGCGKSTVALAMLGYLRAGSQVVAGTVRYAGHDLFQLTPPALQALRGGKIALIPQNAGTWLTPTMRIGQQIAESLRQHTAWAAAAIPKRIQQLLTQVRLPQADELMHRYPHELSGGQQQRVAIAMALAGEPDLLILDEPTTGLDVTTQAHILGLLRELAQATGVAMVYVSHDLDVIARVCARVAVMYAGEIVELGLAQTVLLQPNHPYTRSLLRAIPRIQRQGLPVGLPGAPPPVGSITVGCAFAARCAFADSACLEADPPLANVRSAEQPHQVRCHHWQTLPEDNRQAMQNQVRPPREVAKLAALLQVQNLEVTYRKPRLLARWFRPQTAPPPTVRNVSFALQKGQTLALVGESGSGKSTITRAIAGLLALRAGALWFDGAPLAPLVEQRAMAARRRIQMIFQNPDASLNPRHTVAQILAQPLRLYFGLKPGETQARSRELLQQVRLGEQYLARFPAQLSGGEKQRVAIARAFAAEPDLILCDEIVSALDVSVQAAILTLLVELQTQRSVAYLFIAHDLAVVRAMADQVAVLYQGTLCEIGHVTQVYAAPYHPYTGLLLNAALEPLTVKRTENTQVDAPPARQGCPLQALCPRRLGALCREETPPWQAVADGHWIRCHIPVNEL